MPLLVGVGIGLTINNCLAVLEALFGVESPFQRTAKYSCDSARSWVARRKYGRQSYWLPLANLMAGAYFAGGVLYSLQLENWATLPFLLLFVLGYLLTGGMMFYQTHEQRSGGPRQWRQPLLSPPTPRRAARRD